MATSAQKKLTPRQLAMIAERFGALSEVNRLRLLHALMVGERNVTELVRETGLSQSNVSRHLAVLLEKKMVGRKKVGLCVYYCIVDQTLGEMCALACRNTR
jgi:ArsR family transcriptional regulator